jgi:hypothetical protein
MANTQKQILLGFAKYAEIVNAHLKEMHDKIEILEAMVRNRPELVLAYNQALQEKRKLFSPGPQTQLSAVQQAIQRLPE